MKVVCISGSPRKRNTEKLITTAAKHLKEAGAEVIEIYLSRFSPATCDGCLECDETGKCHHDDGMNELNEHLASADALVIGTPARWALLSGSLKTFIDRTNPLAKPRRLKDKKVAIIAVGQCEGEDAQSIRKAARSVRNFCDDAGMQIVGQLIVEGALMPGDVEKKPEALRRVKQLSRKLLSAC
jgi:multimeric flavodoxin WrbA